MGATRLASGHFSAAFIYYRCVRGVLSLSETSSATGAGGAACASLRGVVACLTVVDVGVAEGWTGS